MGRNVAIDREVGGKDIAAMSLFATCHSAASAYSTDLAAAAARKLRGSGRVYDLVFLFVTADYVPHIEEFCDILRVDGRVVEVAGCTGVGVTTPIRELEQGSGFSLLALSLPGVEVRLAEIDSQEFYSSTDDGVGLRFAPEFACIPLLNPSAISAETWVNLWNERNGKCLTLGGLASAREMEAVEVFVNGRTISGGVVVGFRGGGLRIRTILSQGCRPIGEPLMVTSAEDNIIYALGTKPAYQVLEKAFESLSDEEKSIARGNILAGFAANEYLEEFSNGDFEIRNILGADPNSGAIVIGGRPRVGQTMQYQYRDHRTASENLYLWLQQAAHEPTPMLASLLFRCAARDKSFFGKENHDISLMREILGPHPTAGVLCAGEIGPINSVTSVTGYTAAIALFYNEAGA